MLGLSSIFLFNFFLHVFCNSTKTSANSSDYDYWLCFHRQTSCKKSIQTITIWNKKPFRRRRTSKKGKQPNGDAFSVKNDCSRLGAWAKVSLYTMCGKKTRANFINVEPGQNFGQKSPILFHQRPMGKVFRWGRKPFSWPPTILMEW